MDKKELFIAEELTPNYTMSFFDHNNKEIGELDWGSGTLEFRGRAKESAKVFFNFVKPHIDLYIQNKTEGISKAPP